MMPVQQPPWLPDTGRHHRPDHLVKLPTGMVIVGWSTRHVYRLVPKGERMQILHFGDGGARDGQRRHNLRPPHNGQVRMVYRKFMRVTACGPFEMVV